MAQLLYDYYLKAEAIGGMKARTRLSALTLISSMQANTLPDTEDSIKLFEKAMATIKSEFGEVKHFDDNIQKQIATDNSSIEATEKIRKNIATVNDLLAQRSLFLNSRENAFKRITETLVSTFGTERASIWLYDADRTKITSADLYIRKEGKHSSGIDLSSFDFPMYFMAIETERTLAAHDAHTDPRTSEFSEVYLKPLGINSMLDVPIWANNVMVGVVCIEQVGPKRAWTQDEEAFAYLMANLAGLAIEMY